MPNLTLRHLILDILEEELDNRPWLSTSRLRYHLSKAGHLVTIEALRARLEKMEKDGVLESNYRECWLSAGPFDDFHAGPETVIRKVWKLK